MIQCDHLFRCMYTHHRPECTKVWHKTPNMTRKRYIMLVKIKTRSTIHVTSWENLDTTNKGGVTHCYLGLVYRNKMKTNVKEQCWQIIICDLPKLIPCANLCFMRHTWYIIIAVEQITILYGAPTRLCGGRWQSQKPGLNFSFQFPAKLNIESLKSKE